MIDLKQAEKDFVQYVGKFDLNDFMMKLKLRHSFRVEKYCIIIAESLGLSHNEIEIAALIGLFHDIGRFEQVEKYSSLVDYKTFDHAHVGVEILKQNRILNKYLNDENEIKLVLDAIENHNKYSIDERINERGLIFAKIIRDADKIDILDLGRYEDISKIYNIEGIKNSMITKEILKDFYKEKIIDVKKIRNGADKLVYSLGYIFDINYKESFKILKEKNIIDNLLKISEGSIEEEEFNKIQQFIRNYLDTKTRA
jgi:putative nucleotidyltransferase with HDIG domain